MSTRAYVPPHRRRQINVPEDEVQKETGGSGGLSDADLLCEAFTRVCCVNLRRREDRWKIFQDEFKSSLGKRGQAFISKVERFEAVDGAAFLISENHLLDEDMPTMEWDASNNALYDRHVQPPMRKLLSPGEVGAAMSHVKLWRELSEYDADDSTMLILEDDATLYKGKQQNRFESRGRGRGGRGSHNRESQKTSGFLEAFASMWKDLPNDWDMLYLGISDRGERIPVEYPVGKPARGLDISFFRPTYGFHTHAYALKSSASSTLISNLPVIGPVDVWLADNQWFGLNVYCAVVANEGWHGQGAPLISQRKHDTRSDIIQSGRVE
jgi:GR25 family glycosyltransferase involved in LPS biosynthesis